MRTSFSEATARCPGRVLLAVSLLLAGCAPLSVGEERQLGNQIAMEMRSEYPLLRDRTVEGYVREIGEDILRGAGPQPFEYRFYVVDDESINAFAAPAGFIYVHTGTILKARNVSELSGVIAHEIGHVAKRHIAHNYGRQKGTNLGYQALVLAAGMLGGGAAASAAQMGGGVAAMAYLNSFGREAELEADAFAVDVLPGAGYDPDGLLTFFETLQYESGSQPAGFLSSHPATSDRIRTARERIRAQRSEHRLRVDDGGKLEIIQRRILLLTGRVGGSGAPGRR
jgi:predicted Zn-dependent protease